MGTFRSGPLPRRLSIVAGRYQQQTETGSSCAEGHMQVIQTIRRYPSRQLIATGLVPRCDIQLSVSAWFDPVNRLARQKQTSFHILSRREGSRLRILCDLLCMLSLFLRSNAGSFRAKDDDGAARAETPPVCWQLAQFPQTGLQSATVHQIL